jgi:hypothetical protein
MTCGLCKARIDENTERHGSFTVPAASQVVDPAFEKEYAQMQERYPCMLGHNVFSCLPSTYEIPVCLGCCIGLFRAAEIGWPEWSSLSREASNR